MWFERLGRRGRRRERGTRRESRPRPGRISGESTRSGGRGPTTTSTTPSRSWLCDDRAELDRYWNALLDGGGTPQACGWLVDRFGLRWQIVPAVFDKMMPDADSARSKKVTGAMMQMVKFDVAALENAYRS